MARPLILLTNDDGVEAKGLRFMREALRQIAEVIVVAPATEQSAGSHAITLSRPLRHRRHEPNVHSIDGTPADTVYVALHREDLVPRRPDLVVSGINHGFNLGRDVYYSGTVAAAREAALRGIDAIALSIAPRGSFEAAAELAVSLAQRFLTLPGERTGAALLNVNFPSGTRYRGVRVTRLGGRLYADAVDVRHDPRGREYFWIGGAGATHEPMSGSDTEAIDAGYVSLSPLALDPTDPDGFGTAAWVAANPAANDEKEPSDE